MLRHSRVVHSCVVHPCFIVPPCPLPRCPPLLLRATLSTPALSTPVSSCRLVHSHVVHSRVFSAPHQHSLPPPSRPTRNVTVPRMGLCSPWSVFSFVVSSSSVFDAGRGFGEQSASPLASPAARKIFAAPFDVQRQPTRQRQHPQPHLFPRRLRICLSFSVR